MVPGFQQTTTLSRAFEAIVLAVAAGPIVGVCSGTAPVGVGAVAGAVVTWLAIRAPRRRPRLPHLPALYQPLISAIAAAVIPERPRVDAR